MTILDMLRDRQLLGALPAFHDLSTWTVALTFLKCAYGEPLSEAELALFRHHTGRSVYAPPAGGYIDNVLICGRQGGKDRIAAAITTGEAVLAEPEPDRTAIYSLLFAQDARASVRTSFSYVCAHFDASPMLAREIVARTADTITLRNGRIIAAYPCRPPSARGLRARPVVLNEFAFYRNSENLPVDQEMLRSVRACLATTRGKLFILSSPYDASGALYELHRRHWGRDDSPTLVFVASAPEMNPTLPADYLARMEQDDPVAYRSEVLGEFRTGRATFLDPEAITACVVPGRRELPPAHSVAYGGTFDPSGGRGDPATGCVYHVTEGRVVVDCLRGWEPPFNPTGMVAEAAAMFHHYGVTRIRGDRYSAEWVAEAFRMHRIAYEASEYDRSAAYLELLPAINAGMIELPDDARLLRELRGLIRQRGASGRDRVDHRHAAGVHDDRANVVALAAAFGRRPRRGGGQTALLTGLAVSGHLSADERRGEPPPPIEVKPPGPWRYGDARPCPVPVHLRRTR